MPLPPKQIYFCLVTSPSRTFPLLIHTDTGPSAILIAVKQHFFFGLDELLHFFTVSGPEHDRITRIRPLYYAKLRDGTTYWVERIGEVAPRMSSMRFQAKNIVFQLEQMKSSKDDYIEGTLEALDERMNKCRFIYSVCRFEMVEEVTETVRKGLGLERTMGLEFLCPKTGQLIVPTYPNITEDELLLVVPHYDAGLKIEEMEVIEEVEGIEEIAEDEPMKEVEDYDDHDENEKRQKDREGDNSDDSDESDDALIEELRPVRKRPRF